MKKTRFDALENAGRKLLFDEVRAKNIAKKFPVEKNGELLTYVEWLNNLEWGFFKSVRLLERYSLNELLDFFSDELLETYGRLAK